MHLLVDAGRGVVFQCSSPPSPLLYTNASFLWWDADLLDLTAASVWSQKEQNLHINVLEIKAVILAFNTFLDQVPGQSVVLMSGNAIVVAYLLK